MGSAQVTLSWRPCLMSGDKGTTINFKVEGIDFSIHASFSPGCLHEIDTALLCSL